MDFLVVLIFSGSSKGSAGLRRDRNAMVVTGSAPLQNRKVREGKDRVAAVQHERKSNV